MSLPTIVSAADAGYFRSLAQLLLSVERHYAPRDLRCIVYDLGFTAAQREKLLRRFRGFEFRRFAWDGLPEHVRIRPRAINSNAWKPIVIDAVLADAPGPLLWLDSATVLCARLDPIFQHIARTGLYTPFGGASSIAELTDPRTLSYMGASPEIAARRQRASGVFGADPLAAPVRELVARWAQLSRVAECIIPAGATHATHRFDQSVLNVLLYACERSHALTLTDDEIDVSSSRPCPLYRTRNKLHRDVPLALDPLLRAWFACWRAADVAVIRARRRAT
jgi:hypothetical protein